ncbi:hypothetical protein CPB85DRAFT_1358166 [Mucidula mucida]|nr:hypothetical protein CPB85DRAFT_1358166 [Mucidula mucida]
MTMMRRVFQIQRIPTMTHLWIGWKQSTRKWNRLMIASEMARARVGRWTRVRLQMVHARQLPLPEMEHLAWKQPSRKLSKCSRNPLYPSMSSTDADALAIMPKTANEIRLLAALRESEAERLHLCQRTVELQAANILNEVYCKSLRERLAFQDEKKRKGKGKGKLVGDGLPVLLTSDEFYERVVEFEKAQIQKERGKEECAVNKESLQKELEEWKVLVEEREEWTKNRRLAWAKEKEDHAAEKAKWALNKKAGKVKGKFTKPTPKLGPLPAVIPKPKLQTSIADDEAELDVADGDEGQRGNDDSDDSE